jgi:uncharacterized protein YjbI with pentapeptide repeats
MDGGSREHSSRPFRDVAPRRAVVTPRVRPADGGEVLPVQDHVAVLLRMRRRGLVTLSGPPGSGKSTALAHLLTTLAPDAPIRVFDDVAGDGWAEAIKAADARLVVAAASEACTCDDVARLTMAPWGDDDLIEYLLATHRPQCQAVMFKVNSYARHFSLDGSPQLWRAVLDTMAADESIGDVATALRKCIAPLLSDTNMTAGRLSLIALCGGGASRADLLSLELDAPASRLVRHRPVQLALASEMIVRDLCDWGPVFGLDRHWPHDLVTETARLASHWSAAIERLKQLATGKNVAAQPMAVSVLLAAQPDWRPDPRGSVPWLPGAYVAGAHWGGVDLHRCMLDGADLASADLAGADLSGASAAAAVLRAASLGGAKLDGANALGGDLAGARLVGASADHVLLMNADLHGADLRSASLQGADLTNADLSDAVLTSAKLTKAVLDHTKLAGADLVGVDLSKATLRHVSLCEVNLAGTRFDGAAFQSCEMEAISFPNAKFAKAKLAGCYLTGASMPEADFRGADLRDTGLADVEWEGADLRDADLRGASFHMGSTRSGLVGSAIPCEGSKTGFYTDDYQDREFKNPEEIRKANLCGADLRGAKIDDVDFYLVDLRGAIYSDGQREHFLRCRAILD